jgi:hypothetical protein
MAVDYSRDDLFLSPFVSGPISIPTRSYGNKSRGNKLRGNKIERRRPAYRTSGALNQFRSEGRNAIAPIKMIEITIVASVEARKAAMLEWISEASGRNSKGRGREGCSRCDTCRSLQKFNVMAAV